MAIVNVQKIDIALNNVLNVLLHISRVQKSEIKAIGSAIFPIDV